MAVDTKPTYSLEETKKALAEALQLVGMSEGQIYMYEEEISWFEELKRFMKEICVFTHEEKG